MADVEAVLAWAARGFRVFPLVPGDKVPPARMPWKEEATTDPAKIRAWWRAVPEYNFAVATGRGVTVIDVDAHKDGYAAAMGLDLPHTLTVRTPGGGVHLYLNSPEVQNSVDRIARGIDVRSAGGYVVGPGSFFADPGGKKGYTGIYTIAEDAPCADMPPGLVLQCGAPRDRKTASAISVDAEADIERARHWLSKDAAPAIEGSGGNNLTFKTAARVLEMGLSPEATGDMMLEVWNDRCTPPWARDELLQIVENAAVYMQNAAGADSSAAHAASFGDVSLPPEPIGGKYGRALANRAWPSREDVKPPDWLMYRMVQRRKTSLLVGPGAAGKSSLTLAVAAHVAVGRSFVGHHVSKPGRVVLSNAEDNLDTMVGRLIAVCATYALDIEIVKQNLVLWPGDYGEGETVPPRFRLYGPDHMILQDDVSALARALREGNFDMLVLDPLAKLHSENENDNTAMTGVLEAADTLARQANAGVLLVHHSGKGDRAVGKADAARGASGVVNSTRVVKTLYPADGSDALAFGFGKDASARYARLDDAKMNDAPLNLTPVWFERQSFPLNDDVTTYALRETRAEVQADGYAQVMAQVIVDYIVSNSTGAITTYNAAKALAEDPFFRDQTTDEGRTAYLHLETRIKATLTKPVTVGGHTLVVKLQPIPGRADAQQAHYVMLE